MKRRPKLTDTQRKEMQEAGLDEIAHAFDVAKLMFGESPDPEMVEFVCETIFDEETDKEQERVGAELVKAADEARKAWKVEQPTLYGVEFFYNWAFNENADEDEEDED